MYRDCYVAETRTGRGREYNLVGQQVECLVLVLFLNILYIISPAKRSG